MPVTFESDLYAAVATYLNVEFGQQLRPKLGTYLFQVAITAQIGVAGIGVWSRPDLLLINIWRHKYSTSQILETYGFEVKRHQNCNYKAVLETLAHKRIVNYAYLIWNFVENDFSLQQFKSIYDACKEHEIGLITFSDISIGNTFKMHLSATKSFPSDGIQNNFIEIAFSDDQKCSILQWIKQGC